MANPTPGYMITLYENGAFVGGVMITDPHGIPLDLKYTDPVKPTNIQRIIYGSVLEQYIRNHVIIGALVKEIQDPPSIYIVSQHQLHEIEEVNQMPLVSVQPTQLAPLAEKGMINRSKENECLLQGWHEPGPMRIIFGSMPVDQQEAVLKDLVYLSKHMNLVEPLDRLETALKTLCLEKNQG